MISVIVEYVRKQENIMGIFVFQPNFHGSDSNQVNSQK